MKRPRSASLEQEVQISYKRICDVKNKDISLTKKVKSLDDKIDQLYQKREKYLEAKRTLNAGPFEQAVVPYSQSWTLHFVTKMRTTLPRELRDMVYAQLWDEDMMCNFSTMRATMVHSPCPGRPCQCLRHRDLPTIIDPAYVGQENALEVLEAFYKACLMPRRRILSAFRLEDIKRLLCEDAFHVGLVPATVVRNMDIDLYLEDYTQDGPPYTIRSWLQECFEPLLEVTNKSGFHLHIELEQRHIRLNVLEEFIDVLRPILEAFEREDAKLCFKFKYRGYRDFSGSSLDYSLKSAIADPQNWKQEMAAWLSLEEDIHKHHREYERENDEDYEPEMESSDSEDGEHAYDSEGSFDSMFKYGMGYGMDWHYGDVWDDYPEDFPFL